MDLDREHTIVEAILAAAPTDTVIIAGKGDEQSLIAGSVARPFADAAVARQALGART